MNKKLMLFVVLAFVFVTILTFIQIITNLSFGIIVLPQLAPSLACLVTVLIFKELHRPIIISISKIIIIKEIIAVMFPLTLFFAAYCIGKFLGYGIKIQSDISSIINIGLFGIIIGGITEEIGWRSFLQPSLEQKYTVFISSLVVGLIWGLWHIGHYRNGPIFMLGFIVFTLSVSLIITYLSKNTRYNLIISSLFHISINIGFSIFFYSGFEDSKYFLINSLVWLIAAIIVTIYGRKYYFNNRIV
jgi:membrane protease YdiL (CAAX protease family)